MKPEASHPCSRALMLGALGVVYGDIGTSPLYALRECFHGPHAIAPLRENVLGVLSLISWSLFLIVSIKYLVFVMRAHSKGEGGILALLSLALPDLASRKKRARALVFVGLCGAALLYGDGMITPAVTVLGAIEGLSVVTSAFTNYVEPLTILIFLGLFTVQRWGTGRVGRVFGPIMLAWFGTIGLLGGVSAWQTPGVLAAVNPWLGASFLWHQGWLGFVILGAVFLAVTGAEALYADMGHFGIVPIRRDWFTLVLPALLLNYFGQGALLLRDPTAAVNPFYRLAPSWAVVPLVVLATTAAVIASQALISGSFSLTRQAVQLGFLPRMQIRHTSSATRGQIYMPHVNWALMCCCVGLVLGFRTSSNLASAYGIAVVMTMLATSVLFYFAARLWGWGRAPAGLLCGLFLVPELAFCGANLTKFASGGWFPLVVGGVVLLVMAAWRKGRRSMRERLEPTLLPVGEFLASLRLQPPTTVKGAAVYMAGNPGGTPSALLHNLKHNKVLHETVVLLTVLTKEVSHVDPEERVQVERLEAGVFRVVAAYGFMEAPNVPEVLEAARARGLDYKPADTTFFLGRETIVPAQRHEQRTWWGWLFALLARNAQPATAFFQLPPNRVVELGMQVQL